MNMKSHARIYTTRLWSLITRVWLPPLLCALTVSGCRSVKDVQRHTEYRTVYERDSVFVDCTDTVFVVEKGDTVRITEVKTIREYKWQVLRDTATITDTVFKELKTMAAADSVAKPVKRWRWFLFGFLFAVFIIFAVRIIIKIYLKK